MRSLSQSITTPRSRLALKLAMRQMNLLRGERQFSPMRCSQEPLRFQRRHATHPRSCHRLAEHLILDVAGREDTGHAGMGGIDGRLNIAAGVHVQLALE